MQVQTVHDARTSRQPATPASCPPLKTAAISGTHQLLCRLMTVAAIPISCDIALPRCGQRPLGAFTSILPVHCSRTLFMSRWFRCAHHPWPLGCCTRGTAASVAAAADPDLQRRWRAESMSSSPDIRPGASIRTAHCQSDGAVCVFRHLLAVLLKIRSVSSLWAI
jgi:hypothetical protein